jgi:hypothetical protein
VFSAAAGLLEAILAACPTLVALLQPRQQQQQQQQVNFSCAAMLAGELLHLLGLCVCNLFRKPAVPVAVTLVTARLAVAVMGQTAAGPSASSANGSSSRGIVSSTNSSCAVAMPIAAHAVDGAASSYFYTQRLAGFWTAATFLEVVSHTMHDLGEALVMRIDEARQHRRAATGSSASISGADTSNATVQWLSDLDSLQPAALPDLGLALYTWSALLVQQARGRPKSRQASAGRGGSRRQQQSAAVEAQVPAWHKQFLAAVGAQAINRQFESVNSELNPRTLLHVAINAMGMAFNHFHCEAYYRSVSERGEKGKVYRISVGSLSGVESSLPVRETLLLLLEVMLWDPLMQTQMNCLSRMINILHSTTAAQGSADTSVAAAGVAAAAADAVLQPVLQHLAPMMLAALAEGDGTSSSSRAAAAPSSEAVAELTAVLSSNSVQKYAYLVELLVVTGEGKPKCCLLLSFSRDTAW